MGRLLKAIAIITMMMLFAVGCNKPDEPNNGGNHNGQNDTVIDDNGSVDGHDYIDLGLPSGILWATCNVGAESPEDPGDYFAWGETETKERYDWKQYKYSKFVEGEYLITKYCTNSLCGYNDFVDSLTVLEPVDDAVRVNWGDNWRMPTGEEWGELYQNTTCIMTVQNGVQGMLLTGRNGNSIFLPATGFFLNDELICTCLGVYWTSSLQTTAQISAWSFHFDMDECHVCGTYERSRGQVVRPVRVGR